jgi:hypothetical protein
LWREGIMEYRHPELGKREVFDGEEVNWGEIVW